MKKLFLNPYTVGILVGLVIAIFSTNLAIKSQRNKEAKEQRIEATHMLENIASEMNLNIQKIDALIPMLENAYQDSLFVTEHTFLSTGAFQAALAAGQLRSIPKFAFALTWYYEETERFNKRLDTIQQSIYVRPPSHPEDIKNLRRFIKITIKDIKEHKKFLSDVKNVIDNNKSLIVEDRIQPEIEREMKVTNVGFRKLQ